MDKEDKNNIFLGSLFFLVIIVLFFLAFSDLKDNRYLDELCFENNYEYISNNYTNNIDIYEPGYIECCKNEFVNHKQTVVCHIIYVGVK